MSQHIEDGGVRISWSVRLLLVGIALAAITASVFASRAIWRENGLRAFQEINEQRVQLFANALRSEINRQDHLPIFLSLDASVQNALGNPADLATWQELNRKLARLSHEADTSALYVLDAAGTVRASSDFDKPGNLLGADFAEQPYFKQALSGGRSGHLGVEPGGKDIRYYVAEAVRADRPLGIAMVRIDFDQLENNWALAGEKVFVTDKDGLVFLSSDPVYKSRKLRIDGNADVAPVSLQSADGREPIAFRVIERRPGGLVVEMGHDTDGGEVLYQTMPLPEFGWTIHRLRGLETIETDQRDGGIIGGTLAAMLIVMLLYLYQRHRAYIFEREAGNRLKAEVERRTGELRETNLSLEAEIEERRRAETKLRATQNELLQAGKLAALGQMSAAIAHEINQPLAAIRTFIASTRIFAERGDGKQVSGNLEIINNLADRMASVTSHLKTFARKSEPGRTDPVLVEQAVDGALFLLDSQIKACGARIEKTIQAPGLEVTGYLAQLEQVLVNLLSNALDAVADAKNPSIGIRVWSSAGRAFVSVSDNGPGIPAELIGRIFDPFVTTKPVGRGLGLGLSISYGIVQDFSGHIRASNRPEGGAELTVDLPVRVTKAISPVNAHA